MIGHRPTCGRCGDPAPRGRSLCDPCLLDDESPTPTAPRFEPIEDQIEPSAARAGGGSW